MPLSFTPPNGRDFRRNDAFVDADDAAFERFGHSPHTLHVATVEVACKAEFGVVRELG